VQGGLQGAKSLESSITTVFIERGAISAPFFNALSQPPFVVPGLDPGIHSAWFRRDEAPMEWIAGSSPALTDAEPGQPKSNNVGEIRELPTKLVDGRG
jgi:hypothetical protein